MQVKIERAFIRNEPAYFLPELDKEQQDICNP